MLKFIIYGEPKALARHRHTKKGFTYPNPDSEREKENIRAQISKDKPEKLITGAICVKFQFYMSIPQSKSEKQKQLMREGKVKPAKRPDISNIIKLFEDSFNKFLWYDDSQIVDLMATKFYSDNPRVEIQIDELGL